jgi:hypothetical protein
LLVAISSCVGDAAVQLAVLGVLELNSSFLPSLTHAAPFFLLTHTHALLSWPFVCSNILIRQPADGDITLAVKIDA